MFSGASIRSWDWPATKNGREDDAEVRNGTDAEEPGIDVCEVLGLGELSKVIHPAPGGCLLLKSVLLNS
jgi:hypothetical protein